MICSWSEILQYSHMQLIPVSRWAAVASPGYFRFLIQSTLWADLVGLNITDFLYMPPKKTGAKIM